MIFFRGDLERDLREDLLTQAKSITMLRVANPSLNALLHLLPGDGPGVPGLRQLAKPAPGMHDVGPHEP